jgi:predicted transcriptional regulator of viral defense system
MKSGRAPKQAIGRQRLRRVLRQCGQLLTPAGVSRALEIGPTDAAKLLARWVGQGWLMRIRRGLYAPVPLEATSSEQVLSNPWVLVQEVFAPGYIGGWSAAEHWDLTEQIFRSVCVLTARPVRGKQQILQGVTFVAKHVPPEAIFGTRTVWEGKIKVQVSDPHKTIIDMLDDPSLGGGITHVEACLRSYLGSSHADLKTLIAYGDQLKNGAVFKRLGFLISRSGKPDRAAIAACTQRLSKGNAKLDPALPGERLVTRWRLWVPKSWAGRS